MFLKIRVGASLSGAKVTSERDTVKHLRPQRSAHSLSLQENVCLQHQIDRVDAKKKRSKRVRLAAAGVLQLKTYTVFFSRSKSRTSTFESPFQWSCHAPKIDCPLRARFSQSTEPRSAAASRPGQHGKGTRIPGKPTSHAQPQHRCPLGENRNTVESPLLPPGIVKLPRTLLPACSRPDLLVSTTVVPLLCVVVWQSTDRSVDQLSAQRNN